MRRFPGIPLEPDDNPLILTDTDRGTLAGLDVEIASIQHKKILLLRKAARESGLTAPSLEELRSKSGKPFQELKRHSDYSYRKAVVRRNTKPVNFIEESAYLCQPMYAEMMPKGMIEECDWVKGNPAREVYDNIGPLSGSAGTEYYCKICGTLIGRYRGIVS